MSVSNFQLVDCFETIATGINYADSIKDITQDTKLYLEPEPTNRFDSLAVAIRLTETKQKMGYVSKTDCAILYPLFINDNFQVTITIKDGPPPGKPYCPIILSIYVQENNIDLLKQALQLIHRAKVESDKRKPWNKPKPVAAAVTENFKIVQGKTC